MDRRETERRRCGTAECQCLVAPPQKERGVQPLQKSPLNKINPPLNFIRFFNTLRFFVASTFAARL
jgi:hypothetical protein